MVYEQAKKQDRGRAWPGLSEKGCAEKHMWGGGERSVKVESQGGGERYSLPGSSVQPARERFRSRLPPGGARYSLPPGGARSSLSVKRAACE